MNVLHPDYFFDTNNFQHRILFQSCSFVWEVLSKIQNYLHSQTLGLIEVDIPSGAYLVNPDLISIGKGSKIESGAYIEGPCIIGQDCTIRHGAYLRGNVIAGNGCVLGHDSEFKNALLLDDAHAAHFAYVGDSILGNRVNLGAGVVCANLKLNKGVVEVVVDGERMSSGLRKFGAIIGDDSQIGCNAVTNPGALLGKNILWYPCTNYGGFVPSGKIVRSETTICVRNRCEKS